MCWKTKPFNTVSLLANDSGENQVFYAPPGYLLFQCRSNLMAQPLIFGDWNSEASLSSSLMTSPLASQNTLVIFLFPRVVFSSGAPHSPALAGSSLGSTEVECRSQVTTRGSITSLSPHGNRISLAHGTGLC